MHIKNTGRIKIQKGSVVLVEKLREFMKPIHERCENACKAMQRRPMTSEALLLYAKLQKDIATAETLSFLVETAPETMSPEKVANHLGLFKTFVMSNLNEEADKTFVASQLLKIETIKLQNVSSFKNILEALSPFFMTNMLKTKTSKKN